MFGAFEPVAMRASEREIRLDGFPAMFLSKDVIYLKRRRESKLRNQAVLAVCCGATLGRTASGPSGQVPDSLMGNAAGFPEKLPRSRLHYSEESSDAEVTVQFGLLTFGRRTGSRVCGKVVNPIPVGVGELHRKQISGNFRSDFIIVRLDDAGHGE